MRAVTTSRGEIDDAGAVQNLATAKAVVEEQAEPQLPRRPHAAVVRQDKPQRADDMRRHAQQHLALCQRLAHQAEGALLQIPQSAVDQLGRGRRRGRAEVVLLDEENAKPATCGIARDTGTVDAAANDRKVEICHSWVPIRLRLPRCGIAGNAAGSPAGSPFTLDGLILTL
jgi:hypothetical protein